MATIPDKVNTGALATIVAVGAISMVGISAALTAMVRSEVDTRADQVGAKSDLGPIRKLKSAQEEELTGRARDPVTGRAIIPIDRAMQLVVEDLRQHPEHATAPPPPDAGKKTESPGDTDAGAASDPAAGDAGAPSEPTGAAPGEGTPAEGQPAPEQPAEGAPAEGSQPTPAPAPENQGASPVKPETGNGKNKNKGARHAKAEPAAAPASPAAPATP